MTDPLRSAEAMAPMMLSRLEHLIRSSRRYPDGHRSLQNAIHAIGDQLSAITAGQDEMPVHIIGDRILMGDRLLRCPPGSRSAIRSLGGFLEERGLGGLRVASGVRDETVQIFVRVLLEFTGDGGPGPGPINRRLKVRGVHLMEVEGPRSAEHATDEESQEDPALTAIRAYVRALRLAATLHDSPIRPALRVELAQMGHTLAEMYLESPRRALGMVRRKELAHSHLTHPVHTAVYAVGAGHALGFDIASLEELAQCALVTATVLDADELDDEDRAGGRPMRVGELADATSPIDMTTGLRHSRGVARLLADQDLRPTPRRLLRTLLEHGLGLDLEGMPEVLRWPELHAFAQVLGAAAEFERLLAGGRSGRPRSPEDAIAELREESAHYNPEVVEALAALLPDLEVVSAYL